MGRFFRASFCHPAQSFSQPSQIAEGFQNHLIVVGDPQTIDLCFSVGPNLSIYIEAKSFYEKRNYEIVSLTDNYRSSAPLLQGLDILYKRLENPFGNTDIRYQSVHAKVKKEDANSLLAHAAPIHIVYATRKTEATGKNRSQLLAFARSQ